MRTEVSVNDLLTQRQAGARFGLSKRQIARLREQGLLPGWHIGREVYVHPADVARLLASMRSPATRGPLAS